MINLKSLKLKAFRSFVDEVEFNFPTNGFVLINGKNLDTNDASGTGKSTIFYAIAYALNILPSGMTAKELQCFLTEEKMQVCLSLEDDIVGEIKIHRGKENSIQYSGAKYDGASLLNQHIVSVTGLSSEMLATMCFRPQNSGGLILSKNSTELIEFFSGLLGLDKIESALETSSERMKSIANEVSLLEAQEKSKKETLNAIKIQDISFLEESNQIVRNEISELIAAKSQTENKLEEITKNKEVQSKKIDQKYSELKTQAGSFIKTLESEDSLKKMQVDSANKEIVSKIKEIESNLFKIENFKKEIVQRRKEADQLRASLCPTCNRQWEEASTKLKAAETDINVKSELISHEPTLHLEKEQLQSAIEFLTPNPKIAELKDLVKTFDLNAFKEKQALSDSSELLGDLNRILKEISSRKDKLSANDIIIQKNEQMKRMADSLSSDLKTLEDKITINKEILQKEKDFCRVVGKEGFLGSIFDEVLTEIVANINSRLETIANMSGVSFNFKTESLTTKGVVKKTITPIVTIMGHETKITNLSGGMTSSLELISDIAVKEVIENRTNKKIGFYFADEAFNGQGSVTKEACFDILKQSSNSRSVFVIDHDCQFKEFFDKVIDITMSRGVSKYHQ